VSEPFSLCARFDHVDEAANRRFMGLPCDFDFEAPALVDRPAEHLVAGLLGHGDGFAGKRGLIDRSLAGRNDAVGGIRSPGRRTNTSPTATSAMGIGTSSPSRRTCASSGRISTSDDRPDANGRWRSVGAYSIVRTGRGASHLRTGPQSRARRAQRRSSTGRYRPRGGKRLDRSPEPVPPAEDIRDAVASPRG